jgi:hypothetical protein
VIACCMAKRPRPTCSSEAGADPEHQRGGQSDKRQNGCRPGRCRSSCSDQDRGKRRVDRVHEAKPVPNEVSGEKIAQGAGGECDKKLKHKEFRG